MREYQRTLLEEDQCQDQVTGTVVVVLLVGEVVEVHQVVMHQEHQEVGVLSVLDVFICPSSWALQFTSDTPQQIAQGKPRL